MSLIEKHNKLNRESYFSFYTLKTHQKFNSLQMLLVKICHYDSNQAHNFIRKEVINKDNINNISLIDKNINNSKMSPQNSGRKLTSSDKAPRKHSSLIMDDITSPTTKGINLSSKFQNVADTLHDNKSPRKNMSF